MCHSSGDFCCACAADVFSLVFGCQKPNSSQARHSFRFRFSSVRCCSNSTRANADRDENSDERVTNWAFVVARCRTQRPQQTQMLSVGDGWNGSVRYHPSHSVKTTGRVWSGPLAAACFCVWFEQNWTRRLETTSITAGVINTTQLVFCRVCDSYSAFCGS